MPGTEEQALVQQVRASAEQRLVYTDWLLERGDPRGALLSAAKGLDDSSGAVGRSSARLDIVASLKRVAAWLDEAVPEGRPWRPADVRGVTSDVLGFLSHERGVLHRFRVAPGRDRPLPMTLARVVPTVTELVVPAAPAARAGLSVRALHPVPLLELVGPEALAHFDCLDVELPSSLPIGTLPTPDEAGWRFRGVSEALATRARPVELRLSDGAVDPSTLVSLLRDAPNTSLVWLDRVRVPPELRAAFVRGGTVERLPTAVKHLRLVETPVSAPVAEALASSGALSSLERLEVKDWAVPPPTLKAVLAAAEPLRHLSLIRSPLGAELVKVLDETGRGAQLHTLEASGCLLALGGVSRLLEAAGPSLQRLTVRFNQLTESDLATLGRRPRWPRCEVRFEEVTFGARAHQALAAIASTHALRVEVNGCVLALRPA